MTGWAWYFAGIAGVLCVLLMVAIWLWGRTLDLAKRLNDELQRVRND